MEFPRFIRATVGQDCYPLWFDEQRSYPEGFRGRVFVWDIDKTYLDTHFSSLKGLARIPVEFAVDKRAIPGMPAVLRGLRRGTGRRFAAAPIYFVSASPPQLRGVLERKMLLDGVEHDGMVLKDWLRVVAGGRPGRLREQLGFKLCALLTARLSRPESREVLFGDDTESDAEAFVLYSRLLGGELRAGDAEQALKDAGVRRDDRRCIRALLERLETVPNAVERCFIHLARGSDPSLFTRDAPPMTAVRDGFQLALACYAAGYLDGQAVEQAAESCRNELEGFELENSVADAIERGIVTRDIPRKAGVQVATGS